MHNYNRPPAHRESCTVSILNSVIRALYIQNVMHYIFVLTSVASMRLLMPLAFAPKVLVL